ncbi:MAG: HAD-IA family hydrolase [Bacteroidetes bacterium]|nr:HAD-IA family hydrolase [Bacteroidota bacterium]
MESFFDAIHFTKESGFEKPDPQGFHKIRTKLNVEANECCMVGDHLYKDIIGGHRSGLQLCAGCREAVGYLILMRIFSVN